eukprot:2279507-Ditylum_brightwellii.AAC.1
MAYKLCTVITTTGTTIYHQQLALQQSETNSTIDPRKTFTSDLLTWLKKLHKKVKGSFWVNTLMRSRIAHQT